MIQFLLFSLRKARVFRNAFEDNCSTIGKYNFLGIYIYMCVRFQPDLAVNVARHKFLRREREEKSGESKPNNDSLHFCRFIVSRVPDNFPIYRSFVRPTTLDSERIDIRPAICRVQNATGIVSLMLCATSTNVELEMNPSV